MPSICCALGCDNNKSQKPGLTFFNILKNTELRERWIAAITYGLLQNAPDFAVSTLFRLSKLALAYVCYLNISISALLIHVSEHIKLGHQYHWLFVNYVHCLRKNSKWLMCY